MRLEFRSGKRRAVLLGEDHRRDKTNLLTTDLLRQSEKVHLFLEDQVRQNRPRWKSGLWIATQTLRNCCAEAEGAARGQCPPHVHVECVEKRDVDATSALFAFIRFLRGESQDEAAMLRRLAAFAEKRAAFSALVHDPLGAALRSTEAQSARARVPASELAACERFWAGFAERHRTVYLHLVRPFGQTGWLDACLHSGLKPAFVAAHRTTLLRLLEALTTLDMMRVDVFVSLRLLDPAVQFAVCYTGSTHTAVLADFLTRAVRWNKL